MNEQDSSMAVDSAAAKAGKFLTFLLADEEYGLEILSVQEIVSVLPLTPVPRAPQHVKGVINLRGKIIPVLDLRTKFGMGETVCDEHAAIVVVWVNDTQVGLLVDRVVEVADVLAEQIEEVPAFGDRLDTQFILGLAKFEDRVLILLDIAKALGADIGRAALTETN